MALNEMFIEWVRIDDQIKTSNERIQELKSRRQQISNEIDKIVEDNEIEPEKIDIKLNDSKIKIVKTKVSQTLTFGYLENCLNDIISNPDQVAQIIEYVKSNRSVNYVSEIKRIYNKNA